LDTCCDELQNSYKGKAYAEAQAQYDAILAEEVTQVRSKVRAEQADRLIQAEQIAKAEIDTGLQKQNADLLQCYQNEFMWQWERAAK